VPARQTETRNAPALLAKLAHSYGKLVHRIHPLAPTKVQGCHVAEEAEGGSHAIGLLEGVNRDLTEIHVQEIKS
jgi:hypothetical protein